VASWSEGVSPPPFFSCGLGGGGYGQSTVDFPSKLFCSFSSWGGLKGVSKKRVPIAPHFYPICFHKCSPPFTYLADQKGRNFILQNKTLYFRGASIVSFLLSDGPIKLTHCKKEKKKRTWEAPHLINWKVNRKGEYIDHIQYRRAPFIMHQ
jgi:hypothetical protein